MDINEIDFKSNKEKIENSKKQTVKKKKRLKKGVLQYLFWFISIVFIIACCIFYGKRLIKYYKIYNPSTDGNSVVYMANSILVDTPFVTSGSGAYRLSGNVIYRGIDVNNYVYYSNQLWRIVKIRSDNSIELILDDYINIMPWNSKYTTYLKSDIYDYLNNHYIKSLNKDMLTTTSVCLDDIKSTSSLTCDSVNYENYVTLLDISSYLNSIVDNSTFISKDSNKMWLLSTNSNEKQIWHTSGSSVAYSDANNNYLIKPVVTLASTNILEKGTGTKEDPYIVKDESTDIKIGSYVKLEDDMWRVYDITNDVYKLESTKLLGSNNIFDSKSNIYNPQSNKSLANYLNNTYYNSLSYKDLLVKTDWNIGEYKDSYKDVSNEAVSAYVGILNIADIKFDSSLINYYLSTPVDGKLYMYNSVLAKSRVNSSRPIRPTIAIDKNSKLKGNGTNENPFTVEA